MEKNQSILSRLSPIERQLVLAYVALELEEEEKALKSLKKKGKGAGNA